MNKEKIRDLVLDVKTSYPNLDNDMLVNFLTDLAELLDNDDLMVVADILSEE